MKVSELFERRIDEGVIDKIKGLFKGKKETKDEDLKLQDLTHEDRTFINRHMPRNNADLTMNGKNDGNYVLPTNVTAYSGKGRINFYKRKGQLYAGVGYYRSGSDAQSPKVSPIVHFDEKISSDADMKKLKTMLEGAVTEGILDTVKKFFKKKEVIPTDPRMMPAFREAGGDKKYDVTGWQIGWFCCQADPSGDPKHIFNKMYYGGGSPMSFDEKSFYAGFNACAKSKGIKVFGETGKGEVTAASLKNKELKRDGVLK